MWVKRFIFYINHKNRFSVDYDGNAKIEVFVDSVPYKVIFNGAGDTYSELAGDYCLAEFGQILCETTFEPNTPVKIIVHCPKSKVHVWSFSKEKPEFTQTTENECEVIEFVV